MDGGGWLWMAEGGWKWNVESVELWRSEEWMERGTYVRGVEIGGRFWREEKIVIIARVESVGTCWNTQVW